MIVDDSEAIRRELAGATQAQGYEVFTAENGAQALDVLRENGPRIHVVLSDVNMPDTHLWDFLADHDPDYASWLEMSWEMLDGGMPPDFVFQQLPARLHTSERVFEVSYRTTVDDNDALIHVLVVFTNVTDRLRREREEEVQHALFTLFERALEDREAVTSFLEEATTRIETLSELTRDPTGFLRELHTLKGSASVIGLSGLAEVIHEMESRLEDGQHDLEIWAEQSRDCHQELALEHWQPLLERVSRWFGDDDPPPRATTLRARLETIASNARALGARHNLSLDVQVEAPEAPLSPAWDPFWEVLVHAISNSVEHGFLSGNAPASPRLELSAAQREDDIVVTVQDNGVGIDWERIEERARDLGLPSERRSDLEQAMLTQGFSTREQASPEAGRGVGLAAIAHEMNALGGRIEIDSEPGRTAFAYILPTTQEEDDHVLAGV